MKEVGQVNSSHTGRTVYTVVSRKNPNSPVYEIKPEKGGKSQVVNGNLILPCDSLPLEDPEAAGRKRKVRPRRETQWAVFWSPNGE